MTNEERSGILGAVQPPPKLLIERLTDGDVTCLRLAGTIDEQFDAPGLALTITSKYILLDLGGVDRISSFGIRQWVDFIAAIGPRLAGIYYVECSPKVVDQFNMVANFGGPGYIVSFYAPYRCDTCEQERRLLFRTDEETPLWRAGQAPPSTCPTCNNPEDFDEEPATYFHHVAQQPMAQLPREIMTFLRVHLSYGQGGQRKLKIEKRIEGRTTYLKLAGDLDSDLRAPKLADGLEGEVVIDLSGILSIDPVGTAQWRNLMRILQGKTGTDEQVDRIHFLSVPAPFLERLGRPEELTTKGQVLSLLIPYNCARCRATTQRLVDFVQHGEELRAGRVPRVKCGICGGPVTCVVSETWFSRLQGLPVPQVTEELKRTLARLTAPPPAAPATGGPRGTLATGANPQMLSSTSNPPVTPGWTQQPSGLLSGVAPATPSGMRPNNNPLTTSSMSRPDASRSLDGLRAAHATAAAQIQAQAQAQPPSLLAKLQSVPGLLPGLLVVLLSLSGAIVYRILSVPPGSRKGAADWTVIETSQPKVPPWHDSKYVNKEDLTFIGHSQLVPDRTEALEYADIDAQSELAEHVGMALAAKNPEWRKVVPPLYAAQMQTVRTELDKAQEDLNKAMQKEPPASSAERKAAEAALAQANEKQHELQKRVATLLRSGANDVLQAPALQFWEKRVRGGKGASREVAYQASSLLQLKPESFDRLVTYYGQPESAPQAKAHAVSYFPMLGYRYDPSVTGAIVTDIDAQSPLTGAELKVGDIVVTIAGRDVHSALEFSKLADQAVQDSAIKEVVIKVQRGEQLVNLTLPKKGTKKPAGGGPKKPGK